MRRRAVIVPIVVLGVLLAWRRRRARRAAAPLGAPNDRPPAALLELPLRFVSVGWTLVDAPPDRPELTLRYRCVAGMELDRVDAQETPTQVFVTVLTRSRAAPVAGGGERREHETTIRLSAPLGSRALVHAPVDPEAPGADPGGASLYP